MYPGHCQHPPAVPSASARARHAPYPALQRPAPAAALDSQAAGCKTPRAPLNSHYILTWHISIIHIGLASVTIHQRRTVLVGFCSSERSMCSTCNHGFMLKLLQADIVGIIETTSLIVLSTTHRQLVCTSSIVIVEWNFSLAYSPHEQIRSRK